MKVTFGTLLAITLATGPALPAYAAPGVHLVTSIRALSHAADGIRYAVSVRPVGGPAHAATLVLSTRAPAFWTTGAPGCLSSADRTALACDLGELRAQQARTLTVTARPGEPGATGVPVVARAGAANAPTVTVSLDVAHPAAYRLARVSGGEPAPSPSPGVSEEPQASPDPEASPLQALPEPTTSSAPSYAPETPAPWSAAAVPPRRTPRTPSPARPAPTPRPSHAAARPPAVHAPIIPHVPAAPPAPAAPPLGDLIAGPVTGPTTPALPLPTLAPPPVTPPAPQAAAREGVSELDTLSPAGAMRAGRTSWATVIAIAVVTEAGLLWLVAGCSVMRRRRVGGAARGIRGARLSR
jgi:hypothetical protein